jgi:hypothetical protein
MSDSMDRDPLNEPLPNFARGPLLPPWLARRLLRPDETVVWVRGPRHNPACECVLTHPALCLIALLVAAAVVTVARAGVPSWSLISPVAVVVAVVLVLGSVFVLGIANAYFTRLVVTNFRLVILQGYERRRSWSIDDLPPRLVRYDLRAGGERRRTIDVDALQSMLGGSSEQFVEARSILALGRQLDNIRKYREDDRP